MRAAIDLCRDGVCSNPEFVDGTECFVEPAEGICVGAICRLCLTYPASPVPPHIGTLAHRTDPRPHIALPTRARPAR